MAGVSLAWLLDGACDVVLLEARASLGGNVQTVDLDVDGEHVVVDAGAQYFHPGPYPLYAALLAHLGLHAPEVSEDSAWHAFPASITVAEGSEATPRFVSPALPGRAWPLIAPWNVPGIVAFAVGFTAARRRELSGGSWALTLGDWLPTLGLSQSQWEGMLLPWAASLFSGRIEEARGMSARAAMIFAAKALPPHPLDVVQYYVLKSGMAEALQRMRRQFATVDVLTSARVQSVTRLPHGGFRVQVAGGRTAIVDALVVSAAGPDARWLLRGVAGTHAQQTAMAGIEFTDTRIAIHTDPCYAPSNPHYWSFLNCQVHGGFCEASMWLAQVLSDPPRATARKIWKSWITHRDRRPSRILHEVDFSHLLPTPATLAAQERLRALQGRGDIWFAGGYTFPYDSQETALQSALRVSLGLGVLTPRGQGLLQD
jgi:uncharacterized protein